MNLLNRSSRSPSGERKVRAPKSRVVANGDRQAGDSMLGKVPQKRFCLTAKNETSAIISAVLPVVIPVGGKPHLVQGMHGGMEIMMARYAISAAA